MSVKYIFRIVWLFLWGFWQARVLGKPKTKRKETHGKK